MAYRFSKLPQTDAVGTTQLAAALRTRARLLTIFVVLLATLLVLVFLGIILLISPAKHLTDDGSDFRQIADSMSGITQRVRAVMDELSDTMTGQLDAASRRANEMYSLVTVASEKGNQMQTYGFNIVTDADLLCHRLIQMGLSKGPCCPAFANCTLL
eukprot:TRINITY_DN12344_c0_g1_i1.p1 TRINITY_DN12344_c0_g1~~TRINITY_DN12344_c0_g1_i1.p1  ORF type:complete len:157 (-),score=17.89 TRINITY_DN12344_c0_g1_i1:24-494(-)